MASVINQIKLGDVEYAIAASAYAECSTAAGTAAKVATICTDSDTTNTAFTLVKGVSVQVKFSYINSAANPTLNVNNTGAKPIYYNGETLSAVDCYLKTNGIYTFVYDSDRWNLVGDHVNMDINNFPSDRVLVTSSNGGITSSEITTTNLNCLKGAVTNIQGQLDSKAASTHTHGNITNDGKLNASYKVVSTDGNNKIIASSINVTKLPVMNDDVLINNCDGMVSDQSISIYSRDSGDVRLFTCDSNGDEWSSIQTGSNSVCLEACEPVNYEEHGNIAIYKSQIDIGVTGEANTENPQDFDTEITSGISVSSHQVTIGDINGADNDPRYDDMHVNLDADYVNIHSKYAKVNNAKIMTANDFIFDSSTGILTIKTVWED